MSHGYLRMQPRLDPLPRQFETLLMPQRYPWIKRSLHRRAHRVTNPASRESSRSLSDWPDPICVLTGHTLWHNFTQHVHAVADAACAFA